MLKKYGVTMTYYKYVEVEAKNRKEALRKAHAGQTTYDGGLCCDDSSYDEVEELEENE